MKQIRDLIAPGIYLGMPAETYHSDPALGSSGIRALLRGARTDAETKATILGTALHKILLEGKQSFAADYRRRPDDAEGATPAEKGQLTKAAKAKLPPGVRLLHGDEYDMALDVAAVIHEHPELAGVFDGGLSEVSVFWTEGDIRLKARFDKLKVGGIGDLKSIANERGRRLSVECKYAIKNYRYDIQAEHYLEGRRQMPALAKAGRLFSSDGAGKSYDAEAGDFDYILRVCSSTSRAFQFVFVPTNGARLAWSGMLTDPNPPEVNPFLAAARADIDRALEIYKTERVRFDADPRWALVEPVEELYLDDMPGGAFGWG